MSCHWIYRWPQGAVPPGFNPLRRGWVCRPAPEAPILGGMPTGSQAFLEMPGACGLRLCAWLHPKKALCHTRPVGGTEDKYHLYLKSEGHWIYSGGVTVSKLD